MGIGPSTKETTLHHYNDPITKQLVEDNEVDFLGIVIAGTSDVDDHKRFVADRIGVLAESMRVDGVILSIDSWGNCHIDFTSAIQALGERNIPLIGISFVGNQAKFVVTNSYMGNILDLNKTTEGIESQVVGQNTANDTDALKAVKIIKHKVLKNNPEAVSRPVKDKQLRRILKRTFKIEEIIFEDTTAIKGSRMKLNKEKLLSKCHKELSKEFPQALSISLDIISPTQHFKVVNSILDFMPLATKAAGHLGEGITHAIKGASILLTAVEEGGFQPINIGAAKGKLEDVVEFDTHATPASTDWIIHVDVLLKEGEGKTREGINAAHMAADLIADEIRTELRSLNRTQAIEQEELWDTERKGGMKIALIKLVSGLGCMYDTVVLPKEPCGFIGALSIMDASNNVHILLSPNEYRDGAIHSLT